MATIKEIAREAGVSIATVSYVLNHTAKISPETEKRVLDAVERLGYKPNSLAQGLKRRKSNSIGIITEDITVFNAADIFDGINERAAENHYHIILNNLRIQRLYGKDFGDTSKYIDNLADVISDFRAKQVEGIIYIGSHVREVSELVPKPVGIPLVYTYCYTKHPGDVSICYDDTEAGSMVARYLLNMGHRRISVIRGSRDSVQAQYRLDGFKSELSRSGIELDDRLVRFGDWSRDAGHDIASELLQGDDRPTAIFAMNDLMAIGTMDAAAECGLSVPDDISVIGFDARECSEYYHPQLTTVSLPLHEMGERAAAELLGLIEKKKPDEQRIWLSCKLLERESVKKLG